MQTTPVLRIASRSEADVADGAREVWLHTVKKEERWHKLSFLFFFLTNFLMLFSVIDGMIRKSFYAKGNLK
jgi:hypothetical protein